MWEWFGRSASATSDARRGILRSIVSGSVWTPDRLAKAYMVPSPLCLHCQSGCFEYHMHLWWDCPTFLDFTNKEIIEGSSLPPPRTKRSKNLISSSTVLYATIFSSTRRSGGLSDGTMGGDGGVRGRQLDGWVTWRALWTSSRKAPFFSDKAST